MKMNSLLYFLVKSLKLSTALTQVHDSIIISPQMAPGGIIIAFQSPRIIGH